ncbi:MAG: hypothetical protein COV70_03835 [Parcubacteria group bacterium CG11_big_fil_rev_8_21_14_0_20_39_22]|nr:MAG: hypothetical protein COV70_03835 [Parcubacteria group bacterium CG11_big_fil_rev_8_21_14_0_20_39_22]
MSIIGTLPGDCLAGLHADTYRLTLDFERNEHGHIVLTIIGTDHSGAQEIERLTTTRFYISDWAKSCLLSKGDDGYDKKHRLVAGQRYKVALMPTKEIEDDSDRTTEALRKRGIKKYGYGKPLAGIVPRIREVVSNQLMEKMGFRYIAAPHDIITDSGGLPGVIGAYLGDDGSLLFAYCDHPGSRWNVGGAFAFLAS